MKTVGFVVRVIGVFKAGVDKITVTRYMHLAEAHAVKVFGELVPVSPLTKYVRLMRAATTRETIRQRRTIRMPRRETVHTIPSQLAITYLN